MSAERGISEISSILRMLPWRFVESGIGRRRVSGLDLALTQGQSPYKLQPAIYPLSQRTIHQTIPWTPLLTCHTQTTGTSANLTAGLSSLPQTTGSTPRTPSWGPIRTRPRSRRCSRRPPSGPQTRAIPRPLPPCLLQGQAQPQAPLPLQTRCSPPQPGSPSSALCATPAPGSSL